MFSDALDGGVQNIYIPIFDDLLPSEICAIADVGVIDDVRLSR